MTSEKAFNELQKAIRDHGNAVDLGTPASDEAVKKAESFLGLSFPNSYAKFLKTWGTLSVGPSEFYGIAGVDFDSGKIPNGIWFTQRKRKQVGLPDNLIVVCDNNGDEYYAVDARSGKIVIWDVPAKKISGVKADDIFAFILAEVKEWI